MLTEKALVLVPRVPRIAHQVDLTPGIPGGWRYLVMETGRPLPRAMVLRDSFMVGLLPFLSEAFSRVVYVWGTRLDPQVVRGSARTS